MRIESTSVPRTDSLFWRRGAFVFAGVALAAGASSLALVPRTAAADSGGLLICLEPVLVIVVEPSDDVVARCGAPEPPPTPKPPTPPPSPPTPVPTPPPTQVPAPPPSPVRPAPAPIAVRLVAQPQPPAPPPATAVPAPAPPSPPAVRPPELAPGLNRSAPLLTSTPLALLLAVAVAVASMGGAAAHLVGRGAARR
jgi:hypothetical protein